MTNYKLKMKYPTLPLDWEVGMIVGQGDNRNHAYGSFSPCNGKYTDLHIGIDTVRDFPEFWELVVVKKDYSIESFIGTSGEIATKTESGRFKYASQNDNWGLEEMLIPMKDGFPKIYSVKRLSDGVIFTLGDVCYRAGNEENNSEITAIIELGEAGYIKIISNSYYAEINYMEHFVEKPKEFEVLKYRLKGSNTFSKVKRGNVEHDKYWEIFSVNRLSDNTTFSIGDTVRNPKLTNKGWFTITGFTMDCLDEHLLTLGGNGGIGIRKIEHFNAPILTTEDGVEIFVDDTYVVLFPHDNSICGDYVAWKGMKPNPWLCPFINFSTRAKAQEYVEFNKVQYSMQDILNATDKAMAVYSRVKFIDLDKLPK